jgi:hypothetical protein
VYGWVVLGGVCPMVVSASTQRLFNLAHLFSAADGAETVGQGQGCNATINDIP